MYDSIKSWLRGRHTGSQSDRPLVKTDGSCVAEGDGRRGWGGGGRRRG